MKASPSPKGSQSEKDGKETSATATEKTLCWGEDGGNM